MSHSEEAQYTVFRFEHSRLDARRGVLIVNETERKLRAKSFALLLLLVENAGRLLDRDEIMRALWPDVFVTDDSIGQCIRDIRRAIGDDEARVVRTVPKRGYIFAAEVERDQPASARVPEPPPPATPKATSALATSALATSALAAPPLPDKPSIAVLPFQNMSGDPDQEYFADGMVEEITTALSRIRWLFVIARNSSFVYKGPAIDIKRVSRELGVRYVLEGSVRNSGDRVRVTAQLIDAIGGTHLWADRYDRELNDIFAVQDEIAANVASIIEPALAEAEQQRVLRKPTERLDLWETWQRGLWHFNKPGAEHNTAAQLFFRQTIDLDPAFAPGHYGLALTLFWDFWLYSARLYSEVQTASLEEARIAVSLDGKDAMAHAVLGSMLLVNGQFETALAEARAAYALNPNNAFVIGGLGRTAGFCGLHAEGVELLGRAMRVSPHDPALWTWKLWTGMIQYFARDFDAALTSMREVMRLRPAFSHSLAYVAASAASLGHMDEAREAAEQLRTRFPDDVPKLLLERPPWVRAEDWASRAEGLRLAGFEPARRSRLS